MNFRQIGSKQDSSVKISVSPGHFATNHSHINYYVDLTDVKTSHKMSKKAALILANKYRGSFVDTIICLEGTRMIGAFLADELSQHGFMDMNRGSDISVVTPEFNSNNQMISRDNTQRLIVGKNVLFMISTISTGKTVSMALDVLNYYSGRLSGICAVFSAVDKAHDVGIDSVFTNDDLYDYRTYLPGECEMCAKGEKLDAIVNSFGYSQI